MARGGKREGAGRKAGKVAKKTTLRKLVVERAVEALGGKTPLDVMLEAMKHEYERGGAVAAVEHAKAAAPYVHPRLANIDANVQGDFIVEVKRFAPAPDDEPAAGET